MVGRIGEFPYMPHMVKPNRVLVAVLTFLLCPSTVLAHGIWGHIHVTGWAIENLPPGELRDFFQEPEVLNAALFGAAFTDSGYFPQSGDLSVRSRAYSEHTHWEPFIETFIVWVLENDPPPWDSLESRMRVGFLIGCASHGLQDEIFDSLFLEHIAHHDGAGQDEADPASDGFLALDEHLRWVPEPWVPMETLLELYEPLEHEIDESTIEDAVEVMTFLYVREAGHLAAETLGVEYEDQIPWTRAYYLDESIPGSLRAEINPTRRHQLALWERLHGRFEADDVVVATYPDTPRRLLASDPSDPGSTVTFVFGAGVDIASIATQWASESGIEVDHFSEGTRWGATYPRLLRIRPNEALVAGGTYDASLLAGAELIDGRETAQDWTLRFEVECDPPETCDPVEVADLRIDGRPTEEPNQPDEAPDIGVDVPTMDTSVDSPDAYPDALSDASSSSGGGGGGCATGVGATHVPWFACALVALGARRRRLALDCRVS